MRNIILVSSGHREIGLCSVEELLKILDAIRPQVIFEEIRASDIGMYCNLERRAIATYIERRSVQVIPVDSIGIPEDLHENIQRVLDYVEDTREDYMDLKVADAQNVYQGGYGYLNSDLCVRIHVKMSEIKSTAIASTGDEGLIRGLEMWNQFTRDREVAMMDNIYAYCRENVFDHGVFLVGAAHREFIVKEIERRVASHAELIDWNYSYTPWWSACLVK